MLLNVIFVIRHGSNICPLKIAINLPSKVRKGLPRTNFERLIDLFMVDQVLQILSKVGREG